ncbi:hypothetical protein BGZ76_007721 [Entomortierella beljakovae]|nr:hypothetical protein BGZ76_007721 [Entomortierella beljakovae]
MSPTDHRADDSLNTSTCIINIEQPVRAINTDSSSHLVQSLSKTPSQKKKKTLQVHWHPSVNQRQSEKRRQQILSLLSVLAFFTSLTLILYHYSGCDIATGQCQERSRPRSSIPSNTQSSSHSRKQLLDNSPVEGVFGGEGLLMDSEVLMAAGGRRYKTQARGPWSVLYRHRASNHNRDGEGRSQSEEEGYDQEDLSNFNSEYDIQDESGLDNFEDVDSYTEDYTPEDIDYGEDGGEFEYEGDMNEDIGSVTSQGESIEVWDNNMELLADDEYIELDEDYTITSEGEDPRQRQTLKNRMDPDIKYITYLPDSGLSNQFHGMLRAVMLARDLGRTLILPPITASNKYDDYNSGDDDNESLAEQHQPWSSYFDLETFEYLTGVKVVELQDLRELDQITGLPKENLKCHITCGVGSLKPLDSTAMEFAEQWKFDLSMSHLEIETSEFEELVPTLRSQDKEQLLCISNAFNIVTPKREEWDLFGRYLYFAPTAEEYFKKVLSKLDEKINPSRYTVDGFSQASEGNSGAKSNNNEYINSAIIPNNKLYRDSDMDSSNDNNYNSQILPPFGQYISIHAKRGDYVEYCQHHFQHALHTCLPTAQELASTLRDAIVANPSLKGLPVYVSTDEDRSAQLAEFRALGWYVLDHRAIGTEKNLGTFGPMILDQIFMARAQALIGVRTSAFSRIGAHRQEDWGGHHAVFV